MQRPPKYPSGERVDCISRVHRNNSHKCPYGKIWGNSSRPTCAFRQLDYDDWAPSFVVLEKIKSVQTPLIVTLIDDRRTWESRLLLIDSENNDESYDQVTAYDLHFEFKATCRCDQKPQKRRSNLPILVLVLETIPVRRHWHWLLFPRRALRSMFKSPIKARLAKDGHGKDREKRGWSVNVHALYVSSWESSVKRECGLLWRVCVLGTRARIVQPNGDRSILIDGCSDHCPCSWRTLLHIH